MTFRNHLRDKSYITLLNLLCIFLLSLFLYATNNSFGIILIIFICWVFIYAAYLIISYMKLMKYITELNAVMDQLDSKYLFVECIKKPKDSLGHAYYLLMKRAGKSMIEQVSEARASRMEYRDYIESWVHEIKVPITAAQLICENNKSEITRKILSELEQVDNNVERSLYYARSTNVENDYIVKETLLQSMVENIITKNKQLLMQNGVKIEIANLDSIVYTDEKWIEFILNQIINNSIKYKSANPVFHINSKETNGGIALIIRDNGIGIVENDLPRVFDKGFTGNNGRNHQKSTGIGLYLCKKLCDRLGLAIFAASIKNEYTEITVLFPKGTLVKV